MSDELRRHIVALADQCVKCGLCLPSCPTYALDRNEAESPRGRIALASAIATRTISPIDRIPLDHCLVCLACESVCPTGVHYAELLDATRALLGPTGGMNKYLRALLTRPHWLRAALWVAQASGARYWARPGAHLLSSGSRWRAALMMLSESRPQARTKIDQRLISSQSTPKRIGLFTGCVADVLEESAHSALERLLQQLGYHPIRLPAQCCGAMDAHSGDAQAAIHQARQVHQHVTALGLDHILTATPGCLAELRRALPETRVEEAFAFLDREGYALRFRPLNRRIALHIPCTQRHVAHSDAALLRLLARIPELDLLPLPTEPRCCGAAGSHFIDYPQRAASLRQIKLDQALALQPSQLLSGNIGCRLHLRIGLVEQGRPMPVEHPLSLLAQQLDPHPAEPQEDL